MAASLVDTRGLPVPYITLQQLKWAPIYNQLRELVPGSSDATRDAELNRIIIRASSMINGEVNQNLAATVDTEIARARVSFDGDLRLHTRSNPIIEVLSIEIGDSPTTLTAITDLSNLVLDPWRITVPESTEVSFRPGARLWARWIYVNGYPTTTLAAPATAGDTTITVADGTGIMPGDTQLTIEDGPRLELVVPTAVSGNVLTVAPLAQSHPVGTGVSALPDDIQETTLLLISRLHDTWSLTMNSIAMDGNGARNNMKRPAIMCDAAHMLEPYRRVW